MQLALCSIRTDGGTQPRETINFVTVADYADDMRAGALFPPIVVFNDGADYWLADGFHRLQAAQQAGMDELAADVRQGTLQDAQWYSYSVNQAHGLRRSNEDKRRAVETALAHEYAIRYSNREVARHCGVSSTFVDNLRNDNTSANGLQIDTRLVTRNGQTYEMNTANIGRPAVMDDDEPLSEYEEQIAARYTPPAMSQAMSLLTGQGTIEWYTPPDIIERARSVLGAIDLDPASSDTAQQWIRATTYYTEARPSPAAWGGRVWLNPPFDDTPMWVDRLDSEYIHGGVDAAILLVNSAPGYVWWENLWRRRPVCMLRERLCFWTPEGVQGGQAKKGTTIAYYGEDVRFFTEAFSDLGRIILPED
jgi:hypothetical protein